MEWAVNERYYVLFRSSFRHESRPNISHETVDKELTLCGRKVLDAETFQSDSNNLDPDCITCRKALARSRRVSSKQMTPSVSTRNNCAYCGKPTKKGSMVLDEGQTAHRSCYKEFEK